MLPIRVLVIDDSVVIRRLLQDAITSHPDFEVAGVAANGPIGLARLVQLAPDAVTLDVEMPGMSGLDVITEIRRRWPRLPIVMFSTLTERGAVTTLEALERGASDYVTKPRAGKTPAEALAQVASELLPKLRALCRPGAPSGAAARPTVPRATLPRPSRAVELVVIGVSTGGPNALARIVPALPADLRVPIAIVQHMPPVFTRSLAQRLDGASPLAVAEVGNVAPLQPGRVWVAPGGFHISVRRLATGWGLVTTEDPPENSCRPAVDVLFRSAARTIGAGVLGVVLTGMGQDGMIGAREIVDVGGQVIVQDEESSVVWGMPGFVANAGLADAVLPLDRIALDIRRRVEARTPHGRVLAGGAA